jgi:hypothetical protein
MPDDPGKRGKQDAIRINSQQADELRYWSEKFGVSKTRLMEAVEKVGPMVKDVEDYLGKSDNPRT